MEAPARLPAAPGQPGEEVQQLNSPPHSDSFSVIKNRLSTLTPKKKVDDDQIDAIILLKREIIERMSQLDPDNPIWNDQKDHLVAHGILKTNGAEYTMRTLERWRDNLNSSGANSAVFKQIKNASASR